jgi:hypothetical protein
MHFPHSHRSSYFTAFVHGSQKLIYHYPVGKESKSKGRTDFPRVELFDLATDPTEKTNLANSRPELRREMMRAMMKSLDDAGAHYPNHDGKSLKPVSGTQ